ncbi:MAG: molybdate transport system ATP-binding protein [Methanoregula sp. SKADARSKE-2]|nr:MAG: molybdate transport system ATP-binding protein [Methanoregula sp. SKADARSKE-2]
MLEVKIAKKLRDLTLDLAFRAEPGKIVILMGTNGAGKSMTLNIIAGLICPDSGTVSICGEPLVDTGRGIDTPAEDRRIGYVFQSSAVFPHLSVRENIAFGLRARRLPGQVISSRVDHWLDRLDLVDLAPVKAGKLSGGQKQRVALARALAVEPSLLLLDEPFTALDAQSDRRVKLLLKKYVAEKKIPCIVVTHRNKDIRDVGDRVCVICKGEKSWEGAAADLSEGVLPCGCQ